MTTQNCQGITRYYNPDGSPASGTFSFSCNGTSSYCPYLVWQGGTGKCCAFENALVCLDGSCRSDVNCPVVAGSVSSLGSNTAIMTIPLVSSLGSNTEIMTFLFVSSGTISSSIGHSTSTITQETAFSFSPPSGPSSSDSNKALSSSTKIGLGVGISCGVLLILGVGLGAYFLGKRRERVKGRQDIAVATKNENAWIPPVGRKPEINQTEAREPEVRELQRDYNPTEAALHNRS